jgi:acyl-CoA synthetase (AMP-forming)/AMP-acid ligase II
MLVLSGELEKADLSALRVIAYGTEPMPSALLARLSALLPHVSLVQTYGMSELGVLPTVSKSRDSLWLEFQKGSFETKVVDGTLWVRAPSAMLGYLNAPEQFDEDGFFNTFDMVEQDGDYLRIVGRRSELINVGGQKVYPAEVEGHLALLENVREVLVYARPNPLMGHMVAAKFRLAEPEVEAEFKRRMHAFCRSRLAPFQIPRFVEFSEESFTSTRLKKMRASP